MEESFLDHRLTALGEENKEDVQKIFFAVKFQGENSPKTGMSEAKLEARNLNKKPAGPHLEDLRVR